MTTQTQLPATEQKWQDGQGVETSIDAARKIGFSIAFLVFGLFGLWSAFAPIDSAAHAGGLIRVKSYNKLVQHLEGGIVKEIRVQNGDQVQANDVLVVLDPTQPKAQLAIQRAQLLTFSAQEARLLAEQQDAGEVNFPPLLQQAGSAGLQEMTTQSQVFQTRRDTFKSTIAVLEQRIGQLQSRVEGLKALLISKQTLAKSYQEELDDFRPLLEEGFTDKQRLRQLERNLASAQGDVADLQSNISATNIQIGETYEEILRTKSEFQRNVAQDLADVQVRLRDARERIIALNDIVERTEIRAPIKGVVNNLRVHTEGGVINPREPIAEIVPDSDELVIEATVSPLDIDRVAVGQEATVRLPAFNSKTIPTLYGTVIGVSADAIQDQQRNMSYYQARIALTEESLTNLNEFDLVPGMPAEVFIKTGSRTFLQYLMKPLSSAAARSFIED